MIWNQFKSVVLLTAMLTWQKSHESYRLCSEAHGDGQEKRRKLNNQSFFCFLNSEPNILEIEKYFSFSAF